MENQLDEDITSATWFYSSKDALKNVSKATNLKYLKLVDGLLQNTSMFVDVSFYSLKYITM